MISCGILGYRRDPTWVTWYADQATPKTNLEPSASLKSVRILWRNFGKGNLRCTSFPEFGALLQQTKHHKQLLLVTSGWLGECPELNQWHTMANLSYCSQDFKRDPSIPARDPGPLISPKCSFASCDTNGGISNDFPVTSKRAPLNMILEIRNLNPNFPHGGGCSTSCSPKIVGGHVSFWPRFS